MRNITMAIDERLLQQARRIALDKNTSVNTLVRDFLSSLVKKEDPRRTRVVEELKSHFRRHPLKIPASLGKREDWHER